MPNTALIGDIVICKERMWTQYGKSGDIVDVIGNMYKIKWHSIDQVRWTPSSYLINLTKFPDECIQFKLEM